METSILIRNHVTIRGSGHQPMLFAHGFGCSQQMWRFITSAFETDYRLILFDYVGSGSSQLSAYNPDRYNNLNGYAQDVLDICTALDLTDIIFVGHSVSCMIGLLASLKAPERFSRLILIGPSPCYINDGAEYVGGFNRTDIEELLLTMEKNYIGWANFLAPVVINDPAQPELTQELSESFCSTDPLIARQFAQVTFLSDNRLDIAKSTVPGLVLQCTQDLIAPLEVGMYVHQHLRDSQLILLNATGHCPHLSAPQETIQAINAYLQPSQGLNGR
ncbi:alpha/beta hydrolase [Spirosoma sp. KCTC 42546]|uniref:alpha/beta fold hydrolase n=1 Tax=Spirosoma sp. KCTC 42546 TaxID=2520506 RepID=UPI001157877A|nr:alpha/beta hydrolase [Spirosoma sp. KCTC 42546]QDK77526.1 alpha/beta hydrolase [Spirosoma sp. KCTC 42546]